MGSDVEDAVNRRRQKPRRRRTRESWELIDGGLVQLPHFPLNKHEVPESILEPLPVPHRPFGGPVARPSCSLVPNAGSKIMPIVDGNL